MECWCQFVCVALLWQETQECRAGVCVKWQYKALPSEDHTKTASRYIRHLWVAKTLTRQSRGTEREDSFKTKCNLTQEWEVTEKYLPECFPETHTNRTLHNHGMSTHMFFILQLILHLTSTLWISLIQLGAERGHYLGFCSTLGMILFHKQLRKF